MPCTSDKSKINMDSPRLPPPGSRARAGHLVYLSGPSWPLAGKVMGKARCFQYKQANYVGPHLEGKSNEVSGEWCETSAA